MKLRSRLQRIMKGRTLDDRMRPWRIARAKASSDTPLNLMSRAAWRSTVEALWFRKSMPQLIPNEEGLRAWLAVGTEGFSKANCARNLFVRLSFREHRRTLRSVDFRKLTHGDIHPG